MIAQNSNALLNRIYNVLLAKNKALFAKHVFLTKKHAFRISAVLNLYGIAQVIARIMISATIIVNSINAHGKVNAIKIANKNAKLIALQHVHVNMVNGCFCNMI